MEASAPKLPTEKNYFYRSEGGSHASTCRNLTCYSKRKRNAGEDAHTWKGERFLILPITSTEKWEFLFRNVPNRDTPRHCLRTLSRKWDGWVPTEASMIWIQQTFMKHLLCPTRVCAHMHMREPEVGGVGGRSRKRERARKRNTEGWQEKENLWLAHTQSPEN